MYSRGSGRGLTERKVQQLKELGFVWLGRQRRDSSRLGPVHLLTWEERFEELKAFKDLHGHTVVPQHYPGLGQWVHGVYHKSMKKGRDTPLTLDKMVKLADILGSCL